MTLVEFIGARLDDDAALVNERTRRLAPAGSELLEQFGDFGEDERWLIEISAGRLLAEVAAKRRVVEETWELESFDLGPAYAHVARRQNAILRAVASTWSDHPDFDPEWRLS